MKIVIVEDEYNAREGIKRLIGKLEGNYEVVGEAENGLDGCCLIEHTRPDLVISDIKMPYMNGIEMLEQSQGKGFWHKAILLTGISEFTYAHRALRLGVVDYLEKPITADDLIGALKKTEDELVFQKLAGIRRYAANGHSELLVQAIIREDIDLQALFVPLQKAMGLSADRNIEIMQWYAGERFGESIGKLPQLYERLQARLSTFILFPLPTDRSINLLYQTDRLHEMTPESVEDAACLRYDAPACHVAISNLSQLREGMRSLKRFRKWSLSGIGGSVLTQELIGNVAAEEFQYPEQLDNRIRAAIADARSVDIRDGFTEWENYCFKVSYPPQQIIDATIRLVCSAAKGVAEQRGDHVAFDKQEEWLRGVMEAQTRAELRQVLKDMLGQVMDLQSSHTYSLSVMKALRIIHSRYQSGISLDEIADQLSLTPEYLSSLFNKEVKQTYSSYIKQLRINKAKQLLLASDMKAFEIAECVGYTDAKYFSRVFKEITGLSPGEYQRMYK